MASKVSAAVAVPPLVVVRRVMVRLLPVPEVMVMLPAAPVIEEVDAPRVKFPARVVFCVASPERKVVATPPEVVVCRAMVRLLPVPAVIVMLDAPPVMDAVEVSDPILPTAAEKVPLNGFHESLVLDTFTGRLPEVPVTHNGYIVALVEVSSVIATLVLEPALVAVIVPDPDALSDAPVPTTIAAVVLVEPVNPENGAAEAVPAVAAFRFATCVVEATVNGAVPVATVETRTGADTLALEINTLLELTPSVASVPAGFTSQPICAPFSRLIALPDAADAALPIVRSGAMADTRISNIP